MQKYSAIVLGATGLVGKQLVHQLLSDARYTSVTLLVRRPLAADMFADPNNKLQVIVANFEQLDDYQGYFSVDHVYVCLGTTIKKAGSRAAFRHVDFELVHQAAQYARANHSKSFVWVSSVDANANSRSFYLRVKGELENAIFSMPGLENASAVRPSLLVGDRDEHRPGEQFAINVGKIIRPLMVGPLRKYRPVHASDVAARMIVLQQF